jgi:hypothetical protein
LLGRRRRRLRGIAPSLVGHPFQLCRGALGGLALERLADLADLGSPVFSALGLGRQILGLLTLSAAPIFLSFVASASSSNSSTEYAT